MINSVDTLKNRYSRSGRFEYCIGRYVMKRRAFIKTAIPLGTAGVGVKGCASVRKTERVSAIGFDIHPFVAAHPEAVFIHKTSVGEKTDAEALRQEGRKLASELIVRTHGYGYPFSAKVNIKPNWTCASPKDGKPTLEKLGINTDPWFIEGWVRGMRDTGPNHFFIRECACPASWAAMGWTVMCERADIDIRDLSTMHFWDLNVGRDILFKKVSDGVVFREIGYMAPVNESGSFLVNIAKLKTHSMGVTATVKNLQGVCARRFHQFCTPHQNVRKQVEPRYHEYFQRDFEKRIEELHAKHVRDGIPRWDRPNPDGALRQEVWVQRALDNLSVTHAALHMVEGVYSQDGNGFGRGPHEPLGPYGVTSRDYMTNIIIFGANPLKVDILSHWIAGHEPGNFGFFHIARERGFLDALDPRDIPLYEWRNGHATKIKIDTLTRTPLVTRFLCRDYNGQTEPEYHLCDEPFNYSEFRSVNNNSVSPPEITFLGFDGRDRPVFDLNLPRTERVRASIVRPDGKMSETLIEGFLQPGNHQAVWASKALPGVYEFRLQGEEWELSGNVNII